MYLLDDFTHENGSFTGGTCVARILDVVYVFMCVISASWR